MRYHGRNYGNLFRRFLTLSEYAKGLWLVIYHLMGAGTIASAFVHLYLPLLFIPFLPPCGEDARNLNTSAQPSFKRIHLNTMLKIPCLLDIVVTVVNIFNIVLSKCVACQHRGYNLGPWLILIPLCIWI